MLTHDLSVCSSKFYLILMKMLNCILGGDVHAGWFLVVNCVMIGGYTIYKMNEKDVCDDYGEC